MHSVIAARLVHHHADGAIRSSIQLPAPIGQMERRSACLEARSSTEQSLSRVASRGATQHRPRSGHQPESAALPPNQ